MMKGQLIWMDLWKSIEINHLNISNSNNLSKQIAVQVYCWHQMDLVVGLLLSPNWRPVSLLWSRAEGGTIKGNGATGEGGDYKGGPLGVGTPIVLHSQHVNTRFKLGGRVKSD